MSVMENLEIFNNQKFFYFYFLSYFAHIFLQLSLLGWCFIPLLLRCGKEEEKNKENWVILLRAMMEYSLQERGKIGFSPNFNGHFLLLLRNVIKNWTDGRYGKDLKVGNHFNQELKFVVEFIIEAKVMYQWVIYPF